MVNRDELARRARRIAELGRLRMASRVGLVVLPLGCLSLGGAAEPLICAVLAASLLVLSVGLRFWHRDGVHAVEMGMVMGSVPLVAALALRSCGVDCSSWEQLTGPAWACVGAGVLSGMGLAAHATSAGHRPRVWGLALLVAAATASLGCVGLGLGGLLVTVGAMVASSAVTWVPLRARLA